MINLYNNISLTEKHLHMCIKPKTKFPLQSLLDLIFQEGQRIVISVF